jgi:hypothetical protein
VRLDERLVGRMVFSPLAHPCWLVVYEVEEDLRRVYDV